MVLSQRYRELVDNTAPGDNHWLRRPSAVGKLLSALEKHIDQRAGALFLDAGCAQGREVLEMSARGWNATGVDCNVRFLRDGRANFPQLTTLAARIEHLPFGDNTFDAVLCQNTLFYFEAALGLKELERVLRPGGAAFVTLDSRIIDLERNELVHQENVQQTLQVLADSEVLESAYEERVDAGPPRHMHCFHTVIFRKRQL